MYQNLKETLWVSLITCAGQAKDLVTKECLPKLAWPTLRQKWQLCSLLHHQTISQQGVGSKNFFFEELAGLFRIFSGITVSLQSSKSQQQLPSSSQEVWPWSSPWFSKEERAQKRDEGQLTWYHLWENSISTLSSRDSCWAPPHPISQDPTLFADPAVPLPDSALGTWNYFGPHPAPDQPTSQPVISQPHPSAWLDQALAKALSRAPDSSIWLSICTPNRASNTECTQISQKSQKRSPSH